MRKPAHQIAGARKNKNDRIEGTRLDSRPSKRVAKAMAFIEQPGRSGRGRLGQPAQTSTDRVSGRRARWA